MDDLRRTIAALRSSVAALEAATGDDPAERDRILAHIRREADSLGAIVDELPRATPHRVGGVEIHALHHQVKVDGRVSRLTPTEYRLLLKLTEADRPFDRRELLAAAWGAVYVPDLRSCDVHIANLRRKIEADPRRPRHILTVRGVGYRLAR